jgi:hypothetical protein
MDEYNIKTKNIDIDLFDNDININIFDYNHHLNNNIKNEGYDIISKCLERDGCWEPYQTEITKEILKDGDNIFLDVGGHIGYYSLLASQYNNDVYIIEREIVYGKMIQKNIESNNIQNINLIKMEVNKDFNLDNIIPFDKEIKLIKCDIEGYEIEFIDSIFDRLINKSIKNIILEISPNFRNNYPEYVKKIMDLGYSAYDIGLSPQRKLNDTEKLSSLLKREIKFNDIESLTKYINNLSERQSNFLFSIDDF